MLCACAPVVCVCACTCVCCASVVRCVWGKLCVLHVYACVNICVYMGGNIHAYTCMLCKCCVLQKATGLISTLKVVSLQDHVACASFATLQD